MTRIQQTKITNGILEGLNCKIQLAKRRARGYRNIENFKNMIYFLCGKLKFDYPLYFTQSLKKDNIENDGLLSLLKEHHNEMLLHSPPESVHAFNPHAMIDKNVVFWSVRINDEIVGCDALKN